MHLTKGEDRGRLFELELPSLFDALIQFVNVLTTK